jgi:peptidase E
MTNILLNIYGFQADWAYDTLKTVLTPDLQVCVLTMSHGEEIPDGKTWENLYLPGKPIYQDLTAAFGAYGVRESQISWVSWYHDSPESAQEKVKNAQAVFLTGGLPDKFYERLCAWGLADLLREFPGVVMGASAGAMVQFREYHITPDEDYDSYGYYQGLGLLDGFELEVHFADTEVQRESAARYLRERQKPLWYVCNDGGLLVQNGAITPMGRATQVLPQ